ncbi:unnamed protein product [Vitrella brassicaformis CCMP3155]|uniref:Uncharacterized protein n=2 Tax=Vitrella brassicaformis TaxID=1169539 RepID=A0A0G4ETL8_VITBC|nr:unnamed protein product [Vitrella brassicaformis CCMP3155]|eukprot:CEM01656.1 unnamed protein product [Vitrella brassicaformis CCMP3155]
MTPDEEDSYRKLKKVQHVLGLFGKFVDISVADDACIVKKGMMQTAFVDAREVPPVLSELLEANKDSLKKITLDINYCSRTSAAGPIVFSSATHLHIRGLAGRAYISDLGWRFPALTTLQVGHIISVDADSLVRLLDKSPKIERLGFRVRFEQLGRIISQLKDTLSQHWSKADKRQVPKKLGIVVEDISSIGVRYGRGKGAAVVAGVSEWAADVNCQIECWPVCLGKLTIYCSTTAATAPPAPDGLYGQIATWLAANATHVRVKFGGTPLDESWRHKLIFHKAKKLTFNIKPGASASEVVDSIPTWLTERQGEGQQSTSRHFPAVEHMTVFPASLSLADVHAARSKLSPLLGGLTTLKRVDITDVSSFAAAHELLCCLSVDQLDEVTVGGQWDGPVVCEWPEDAPDTLSGSGRCPLIHHLTSGSFGLSSKAGVREFIKLALALRPVSVRLVADLNDSELTGDSCTSRLAGLRSFMEDCLRQVAAHYTFDSADTKCEWYRLTLKLRAK